MTVAIPASPHRHPLQGATIHLPASSLSRSSAPTWFWGCQDGGDSISILKKLKRPMMGRKDACQGHDRGSMAVSRSNLASPCPSTPLWSPALSLQLLASLLLSHVLLAPSAPTWAPGQLLPSSSLGVRCSLLNDHDAAQGVITKHHILGSLNNRNLFSPFQRLGV